MKRRLIGVLAVVCALAVPAAGCGGGDDPPGPAGPDRAAVAWAGRICGAVKQSGTRLQLPTVDAKNGRKSRDAIVTFLGQLSVQLKAQETTLRNAGAPPVEGTEQTYRAALGNLSALRAELDGVTGELRTAKVTDIASLNTSLTTVGKTMQKFNTYGGPAKDLRANPALNTAFAHNPQCGNVGV